MAVLLGGSSIKSIQKVSGSGTNSATVTISAVDVDKTFVSWIGGGNMDDHTYYAYVDALSSTSVTFRWGGGETTSCNGYVVEYN
tara:strand:+ start:36 stop:287 length:252 start_codon:yes stop_codon:yes gene_type:complete